MKWVKLTSLIKLEWWKLDINTLNFSIKLSIVYGVWHTNCFRCKNFYFFFKLFVSSI